LTTCSFPGRQSSSVCSAGLAERWEISPIRLTYYFSSAPRVKSMTAGRSRSRDVEVDFRFPALPEQFAAPKPQHIALVDRIDAPDDFTRRLFYMKEPDAALLWNISDGAIRIVPFDSGK